MTLERSEGATARTTDADIAALAVERDTRGFREPPLYEVQTRKVSGEWSVVASVRDPNDADLCLKLLRWSGADARVVLIEQPIP
jgi:hypothetical protein